MMLTFDADSEEVKDQLEENPELALKYSKMVESELNKRFRFIIKGTPENAAARQVLALLLILQPRHALRMMFSMPWTR